MVRVNLIPASVQSTRIRRAHIGRWCVAGAAAVAALAIALGLEVAQRTIAKNLRAEQMQVQAGLEELRKDLRVTSAQAKRARLRLERAIALRAKRAWSGMVALIAEQMPKDCWLVSLATDPTTPSASPTLSRVRGTPPIRNGQRTSGSGPDTLVIDAPRKLDLVGYAPQAAQPHQFVTALKRTGVFTRVSLERSQREPVLDGSYFRFELSCEW